MVIAGVTRPQARGELSVDLLAKPVGEITYQYVADFCIGQAPESTVLDCKQRTPRDLAKHVAGARGRRNAVPDD